MLGEIREERGEIVVGCWLLAVGRWLLAVGCWLLAEGLSTVVRNRLTTGYRYATAEAVKSDSLTRKDLTL